MEKDKKEFNCFLDSVELFLDLVYDNWEIPKHLQETYANQHCNLLEMISKQREDNGKE